MARALKFLAFSNQASLDKNEFGYDLPTNERLLDENDQLHKEIHQFQQEIDKTCAIEVGILSLSSIRR